MVESFPRIIVTTGDPAGIGPDIMLKAAEAPFPAYIAAIGDRNVLEKRARMLKMNIKVVDYDNMPHRPGVLSVIHHDTKAKVVAGELNPKNSEHVVQCIDKAVDFCTSKKFDAMVTGPVNKAVINQAGIPFSGHTEWIAQRCFVDSPVMMLANDVMRVCLLTTHIPFIDVPRQITSARLKQVIGIIFDDLYHLFKIRDATLGVCGLNPHAGESGYIGKEEVEVITPVLDELRAQGANIVGPISADTAFTPARLESLDAVLAMYHDQGLPAIKHAGFGEAVNITLGLPIVRTSVDHGTAPELAGSYKADESSLKAAVILAHKLINNKKAVD